tara:strand:- start:143 stop:661 length:519 start_codon:yes stop_codon:yes gene_type:complete
MNCVRQIKRLLLGLVGIFLISCGNPYYKALKQLENMPEADYSYAVEPEFNSSKDELEFKIKGLYEAEEVRFSIATFHGYDNETMEQINEDYWVHFVLYNSPTIDIYDKNKLEIEGRKIAELVMDEIKNTDSYDKIQITFMKQWKEGDNIRQIKHPEFYKYPSFEETTQFEEE